MNSLFRAKYERLSHILQTVKQTPSRNIKNALLANLVYECDSLDVDFIDFLVTSNQKETETVKPFPNRVKPLKSRLMPFYPFLNRVNTVLKRYPKARKETLYFVAMLVEMRTTNKSKLLKQM